MRIEAQVHGLMEKDLPYESLTYLAFSLKDSQTQLEWEHSREFEFEGNMYDVMGQEICGDTIGYWCWLDHKENRINKSWTARVSRSHDQSNCIQSIQLEWSDWFKNWCESEWNALTIHYIAGTLNFSSMELIPLNTLSVELPPPRSLRFT